VRPVTSDERLEACRRADAFTNAATVLMDAAVAGKFKDDPETWYDIEEIVIPMLEVEADKGSQS
jgi:hypothetical protein